MSHQIQCLLYCQQASQSKSGIIIAASGSYIHTFSAQNGKYLYTWPSLASTAQTRSIGQDHENNLVEPHPSISPNNDLERPLKRQKLSPAREESGSSSAEIVVTTDTDDGDLTKRQQPLNPPVIKLAGTSAGQHVVAVTGEDKCIRVFNLAANGTLTQLSER